MTHFRIQPILDWLKRVVTDPLEELGRWQRMVRHTVDFGRFGWHQLREDRAPQMAGALAFRTLFGLLPVLIVGTIVVRAFRGVDQFRENLSTFFADLGLDSFRVVPVDDGGENVETLSSWLLTLVEQAEQLNVAAIGWVGMIIVAYSAIGLMVTIENSFNTICRAPEGRAWSRRVPMYWFVLTMGPVALGISMFVDARFDEWLASVDTWQWVLVASSVLWGFVAIWLFMLIVYSLVPNTGVSLRAAMIGAVVAAMLLEIGRRSLGAYLENALSIRQLYGSLGLVPLFMFWVYLMWLFVLFGLEVAATVHMLGGRRLEEMEQKRKRTGLLDPAVVVTVMEVIARQFDKGHPSTARLLVEKTGLPESTLQIILDRLVLAGLLHRLSREAGAVALAKPPEQTSGAELIEIGFALVDESPAESESALIERLREAQRQLVAKATLATLSSEHPSLSAGIKSGSNDGR